MNSTVSRFFGFAFLLFPLAIAHLQAISRPGGYTAKAFRSLGWRTTSQLRSHPNSTF